MAGRLAVASTGDDGREARVPDLADGDYLGEIGLMQRVPRTATVTAVQPTRLLRFPGAAFLEALTAYKPSPAVLDGAALRLRRTHPAVAFARTAVEE